MKILVHYPFTDEQHDHLRQIARENARKGYTAHELRARFPSLKTRLPSLWSRSYYAGSIGQVSDETVRRYIEAQKGV